MTLGDEPVFLGRGWAFPFRLDAGGRVALAELAEDVRQAVLIIIQTNHNERVMRPDFGANLGAMVFEPLNTTTMELVRHQVEQALILWEPRIDGVDVRVTAAPPVGRLDVAVRYRIRSTNTFYNLVYPFYLQEGRT